jgi:hypothetical protein
LAHDYLENLDMASFSANGDDVASSVENETAPAAGEPEEQRGGFTGRLRRLPSAFKRQMGWLDMPAASGPVEAENGGSPDGLHIVTRGCDISFGMDASVVEKRALELAAASAQANLPRMDVQYDEVPEEVELKAQCRAVFHDWVERVRTKVQDALQESTQKASSDLKALDSEIGALESTLAELPVRRQELSDARREAESGQAQLEIKPFMKGWQYFLLIALLVLVDWIANVPVFSELLPKDPGADAAFRALVAHSESWGLFGGFYRVMARAANNVDASILALGTIVFLVWLAHAVGEFSRRWVSHSAVEHPDAALTIRAQKRLSSGPAIVALVGMMIVLSVLFMARSRLDDATRQRVDATQSKLAQLMQQESAAEASGDLTKIGTLQDDIAKTQTELGQEQDRATYAATVSGLNLPILFLNIVLAITAAVAAYLRTGGPVMGVLSSRRVVELQMRVTGLIGDAGKRRSSIAQLDTSISRSFGRVEYLLRSRPLSGWRGKAERLEAIIPSFRAGNARLRGIDAPNIAAFRNSTRIGFALDEEAAFLSATAELEQYRKMHVILQSRAAGVLSRIDTALNLTN